MHHSGTGPGIILISDQEVIDAGIKACTNLFAEEGYSVLALGCHFSVEEIIEASQIFKSLPQTEGNLASIGYGKGALLALQAASLTDFAAIVAFDLTISDHTKVLLDTVPCPFFLQFGTKNHPENGVLVNKLKDLISRKDGSRVFAFEEGGKGFSIPFRDTYNKLTDGLAHTRSLELIRRVLGPYYDYAELFANHVYHEFITRDVEETMKTMIDDPYLFGKISANHSFGDIYAMGGTLYELLSGRPPFYTGDLTYQIINVQPHPLAERLREMGVENEIPPHIDELVMACLAKETARRPQSASVVAEWIRTKGQSSLIPAADEATTGG